MGFHMRTMRERGKSVSVCADACVCMCVRVCVRARVCVCTCSRVVASARALRGSCQVLLNALLYRVVASSGWDVRCTLRVRVRFKRRWKGGTPAETRSPSLRY